MEAILKELQELKDRVEHLEKFKKETQETLDHFFEFTPDEEPESTPTPEFVLDPL